MYAIIIEPFSLIWWRMNYAALFIGISVLLFTMFLPLNGKKIFAKYLGVFLLFDLCFFECALYHMGAWNFQWALPLHYCTIMELAGAITLITRLQWLYEVIVFLGMIGPLQALLAPALPYEGGYFFYDFYVIHGATIFAPIFLVFSFKMRPRKSAWWRVSLSFFLFSGLVFCFNYITGSNYMFLMEKPPLDHPLLEIGEWPNYIFIWGAIIFTWSFLLNLVFVLSNQFLKKITAER